VHWHPLLLTALYLAACGRLDADAIADRKDQDGDGATLDQDCDDLDPEVQQITTWYDDQDGDGHGAAPIQACHQPMQTTTSSDDCDDTDPETHPGADEVWYDGRDQDCAGGDDYDQDGDGHPSDAHGGDDCVDTEPTVHPDQEEICGDGLDNDCDGLPGPCLWASSQTISEADGRAVSAGSWMVQPPELAWMAPEGTGQPSLVLAGAIFGGGTGGTIHALGTGLLGPDGAADDLADWAWTGPDGGSMGGSLHGQSDFDGDGFADLAVASAFNPGQVAVELGAELGGELGGAGSLLLHPVSDLDSSPYTLGMANQLAVISGGGGAQFLVLGSGAANPLVSCGGARAAGRVSFVPTALITTPGTATLDLDVLDDHVLSTSCGDAMGADVAAVGDTNGDGLDDLAIGIPGHSVLGPDLGALVIFTELPGGVVAPEDGARIIRNTDEDSLFFGRVVAEGGDLTGDGLADIWVNGGSMMGLFGSGDAGSLSLIAGSEGGDVTVDEVAIATIHSGTHATGFGHAIHGGQDMDGDGRVDVLVGEPYASVDGMTSAGQAHLFAGPFSGSRTAEEADVTWSGEEASGYVGWSVLGGRDLTGDGFSDVILGGLEPTGLAWNLMLFAGPGGI